MVHVEMFVVFFRLGNVTNRLGLEVVLNSHNSTTVLRNGLSRFLDTKFVKMASTNRPRNSQEVFFYVSFFGLI